MEFYKLIQRQINTKTFVLKVLDKNTNKLKIVQVNANCIDDAKKVAILQYNDIIILD